jgi:uncharacterized membrane protein (DUF4010 family)
MTGNELVPLELAWRLALALGLAVFLGLTFEEVYKREERSIPGGVRTFPMLALAGAMLYLIEPRQALAFMVGLVALAIWLYAFLRQAPAGAASLMVPASNLIAYLIGPVALAQPPWVVVAASVTAVLLLGTREKLHGLIRIVPQDELLTAGSFLILVGIILPLVPDQPVTALTPLTPFHLWLAVVAVCTLSYLTYLLQRYAPARNSTLLPAILGGVYSSTATTVMLAKRQREAGAARSDLAAGIVVATAMMYLRLGFVVALFDLGLARVLAPPLAALFAIGATLSIYEWRRSVVRPDANLQVPVINPLEIPAAITFGTIFVAVSVVTVWIHTAFGQTGVLVLAALVGATDIDPFVINIAQGGVQDLSVSALAAAVLIAASSNNIAKAAYALGFGGLAGSRRPASMLVIMALVGFAIAAAYVLVPNA